METTAKYSFFWTLTQYYWGVSCLAGFSLRPKAKPTRKRFYGFTALLIKVIRELKPDYIAAAYDLPKPTFRHIAYDKYKAGRAKMDDSLAKQINRSHDILKAFNIPVYSVEGFEADDVLGTVVKWSRKIKKNGAGHKNNYCVRRHGYASARKKDDVVVYTLKESTKRLFTTKKRWLKDTVSGQNLLLVIKALKGDPSDNIIGVKGIGKKAPPS